MTRQDSGFDLLTSGHKPRRLVRHWDITPEPYLFLTSNHELVQLIKTDVYLGVHWLWGYLSTQELQLIARAIALNEVSVMKAFVGSVSAGGTGWLRSGVANMVNR